MKRKYPRATLRKILKGKRKVNLSKSVDIVVSELSMRSSAKLYCLDWGACSLIERHSSIRAGFLESTPGSQQTGKGRRW